jgi:hypothetical protein
MTELKEIDLEQFWSDSEYFTNPKRITDEMILGAESQLGYSLPKSYIRLLKSKNGGTPLNVCFPTKKQTSWADDHIQISGIKGIEGEWGINSDDFGNDHAINEMGYPKIGIAICECPSGGHDIVMLDYRKLGKDGEPQVVHVDQEDNYKITFLANTFEAFICGLVNEKHYDTSKEDA